MYIGNDLQVAESGNKIIDDISSSFNGSTTSFALLVGGAAPVPFPINTQQIYISVNGVIQEPDPTGSAGFKLLGNNIVFSSAPANGHAFFGVILSGADYVTVGTEFPAGSATAPSITFGTDNNTGLYSVTGGTMGFTSDGVQTFTMDGDGFNFPDDKKVQIGSSDDLQLYHSSGNSFITNATGTLKIRGSVIELSAPNAEVMLQGTADAALNLYHNGLLKFATTATGTNVTGIHVDDGATHDGDVTFTGAAANVVWDKSADDLIFNDNAKATFGTSSDLQLYHDGTNSYVHNDNGSGWLYIQGDAIALRTKSDSNEIHLTTSHNGAVTLYHNNVRTLFTTASGAAVYGPEGGSGVLEISSDEADDNADIWRLSASASASELYIQNYASGAWETSIKSVGNGAVELYHDNTKKLYTENSGVAIDGDLSIETNGYIRVRATGDNSSTAIQLGNDGTASFTGVVSPSSHVDMPDNAIIKLGTGDDLQLSHNGSLSLIQNATGNLYLDTTVTDGEIRFTSNGVNENMIRAVRDAQVELYHNGSVRLATTAGGNQSIKAGQNDFILGSSDAGGVYLLLDGDSNGDASGSDYSYIAHDTSGNLQIAGDNPAGNAAVIFSSGNSAAAMRIDSSGRLLIGHTSTVDTSTFNSHLQVMGTDAHGSSAILGRFSNDASSSSIHFSKSRNGTKGSHTVVQDNDGIGNIFWWASDGSDYEEVARIGAEIDGTPGSGDTPGALTFHTTADGASTSTERLRITSSGVIGIGSNSPGTSAKVFSYQSDASAGNNLILENNYSAGGTTTLLKAYRQGGAVGWALQYKDSSTTIRQGTYTNHQMELITNDNARLTLHNDGHARFSNAISFNNDTATSNYLDDYEEGTWTPGIGTTSGASVTGEYRKIGNAVHIQMYVSIPSHSNSSTMSISGLPFSAMASRYASFTIGNFRFFNFDGGYVQLMCNQAGTTMTFREQGDNLAWQNAEWSQVSADFAMYLSGTYFTA